MSTNKDITLPRGNIHRLDSYPENTFGHAYSRGQENRIKLKVNRNSSQSFPNLSTKIYTEQCYKEKNIDKTIEISIIEVLEKEFKKKEPLPEIIEETKLHWLTRSTVHNWIKDIDISLMNIEKIAKVIITTIISIANQITFHISNNINYNHSKIEGKKIFKNVTIDTKMFIQLCNEKIKNSLLKRIEDIKQSIIISDELLSISFDEYINNYIDNQSNNIKNVNKNKNDIKTFILKNKMKKNIDIFDSNRDLIFEYEKNKILFNASS